MKCLKVHASTYDGSVTSEAHNEAKGLPKKTIQEGKDTENDDDLFHSTETRRGSSNQKFPLPSVTLNVTFAPKSPTSLASSVV